MYRYLVKMSTAVYLNLVLSALSEGNLRDEGEVVKAGIISALRCVFILLPKVVLLTQ